ncbi:MAG: dTDP-4-dehydrorhamnose 3,5-epimerase [Balneolaceae bacterium]|nr:dTDP-4-dehydrorhamnose 3,5-epimerase [Balneolaceae bacterium]
MEIKPAPLKNILVISPDVYTDNRGSFLETFRSEWLREYGLDYKFVQDNISVSKKGVLRGLHYQLPPVSQVKLVMAAYGEILDVAVDMRKQSPTFGQHFSTVLSAENRTMLLIPSGFAHGFSVLSDEATVYYKCNNYYNKELERGIRWDDPELNIEWKVSDPVLSEKDRVLPLMKELKEKDFF